MKRLLIASLLSFVAPLALAQNAIIQDGTALQNSPTMFSSDRHQRQGAGAAGAATNRIITTGTGVVGGVCDFSAPTDDAAGYNRLCLDSANGRVLFESTKSSPPGLVFNVLGSDYSFFGLGNGNVSGPTTTTVNELASWNSPVGAALRQGAATLTDNKTGAVANVDAAGLTIKSQAAASAQFIWSCILSPTACASFPANYDAVRGVAINPNGSLNLLTNGVGSYILNSASRANPVSANPYPVTVNFFGASVCDADNCGVWGLNTALSDNRGTTPTVHGTRYLFNELDFQVASINTQISGLNFTGASTVQPAYAVATGCLSLDQLAGAVAKWTTCHVSTDGVTTSFAAIGAQAASGTNISSQSISFGYFDAGGLAQDTSIAGTSQGILVVTGGGATAGNFVLGTVGSSFVTASDNSGLLLNNRFAALTTAATLALASDVNWTTINIGNASAVNTLFGTRVQVSGPFLHTVLTVATLPVCAVGTKYHQYTVSDATAPTYNANVVGGGAVPVKVMCDGANWKSS